MRAGIFLFLGLVAAGTLDAGSALSITAATDHGYYREGAADDVYVEAHIVVTPSAEGAVPTTPRNIALVVDRSGSMAGQPMQMLRQALTATLGSLADRDTVAVVAFGSEVETVMEAQHTDQTRDLAALLAQLEPAGGAALYDALNQGAAQLRRYAGPNTVSHLVLITDGPPTKGPRELDDFSRLAEVFAREGIAISTIGLGEDFDEDLLATLARVGNGRFRYVRDPAQLPEILQAELAPLQTAVAHDAVLTVEFKPYCDDVKSHGWEPATVQAATVTYLFPYLFADQDVTVLASGQVRAMSANGVLREAIRIRLRWREAQDDQEHEVVQSLPLRFLTEDRGIRESVNASVFRTAASAAITEGMQDAIERLDKNDFRGALRALRRARNEARDLNYDLEDEQIAGAIRRLDTYLAEVQSRGLNQLDRKVLRSGLFNQFESPMAGDSAGN